MTTLQAANHMADCVDKMLALWESNNPQSVNALIKAIDSLEKSHGAYEKAVENDKRRRTDDPRLCTWPRCAEKSA